MAVILVTGANGFVGQALCKYWQEQGHHQVRPVLRRAAVSTPASSPAASPSCMPDGDIHDANRTVIMDIGADSNWLPHLAGVDCIVHLAARVHVLADQASDPLALYRAANVDATLNLARQAARSGVRRFIFLSSIKVLGEATAQPFRATDLPQPQDPYGVSKLEAEHGLAHIAAASAMELVIIRPPLVYGPGVKANFLQLMRLVARGLPLPLASVQNRRSMVYVGNLVSLIECCRHHPAASGQTLLVSDGADVSTAQLIATLARAMGRRAALFACPPRALMLVARLLGKAGVAERLLGSLQVDMDATCQQLAWQPPSGFEAGIAATVAAFQQHELK